MAHKEDCQCIICKRTRAKKEREPAPTSAPETTEEHMARLGCFSPGEVAALLKADVSHEKIDQLARNKGVGLELPPEAMAQAEAIIKGVEAKTEAGGGPSTAATGDQGEETPTGDPMNEAEAGDKPPLP